MHLRPCRNGHPRFPLDSAVADHCGAAYPVVPGFYPAIPASSVSTSRLRHQLIPQLTAAARVGGRLSRLPPGIQEFWQGDRHVADSNDSPVVAPALPAG